MIKIENTTAYTPAEVAKIIGRNADTVRRYIRSGDLKAQKIGRTWYVTEKTLLKFVTGETPEE